MNNKEMLFLVFLMALSVQITRWLPFLIFRNHEKIPSMMSYLGKMLPAAVMGLLCVYCFKDYNYSSFTSLSPAILASAIVIIIHIWKKNTVMSIALGTIAYMIFIRVI